MALLIYSFVVNLFIYNILYVKVICYLINYIQSISNKGGKYMATIDAETSAILKKLRFKARKDGLNDIDKK